MKIDDLPPFHHREEFEIYLDKAKDAMKKNNSKHAYIYLELATDTINMYVSWRREYQRNRLNSLFDHRQNRTTSAKELKNESR